ncbi:hypothetical protein ACFL4L_06610 [bacterium]
MKLNALKDCVNRLVPMRCQICGSWGHSSLGTKWICNACLAKLFDEKRVTIPSKDKSKRTMQISLF